MVNEVSDEVVGFGSIEFLLKDPDVTEVMVNGPDDVYVERGGRIERAPDGLFEGEEPILHLIERIVGPLGLRVDESSPSVGGRQEQRLPTHHGQRAVIGSEYSATRVHSRRGFTPRRPDCRRRRQRDPARVEGAASTALGGIGADRPSRSRWTTGSGSV